MKKRQRNGGVPFRSSGDSLTFVVLLAFLLMIFTSGVLVGIKFFNRNEVLPPNIRSGRPFHLPLEAYRIEAIQESSPSISETCCEGQDLLKCLACKSGLSEDMYCLSHISQEGCDQDLVKLGIVLGKDELLKYEGEIPVDGPRFTLSVWVYPHPIFPKRDRVIATSMLEPLLSCDEDSLKQVFGYALSITPDSQIRLAWNSPDGCHVAMASSSKIQDNKWTHVGFTFEEDDSLKVSLYVDGGVVHEISGGKSRQTELKNAPHVFLLGGGYAESGRSDPELSLNGRLSNVAAYNGVFTSALLWKSAQSPPIKNLPPKALQDFLILHYRLGVVHSGKDVIIDSSKIGLNIRLMNSNIHIAQKERLESEVERLRREREFRNELRKRKREEMRLAMEQVRSSALEKQEPEIVHTEPSSTGKEDLTIKEESSSNEKILELPYAEELMQLEQAIDRAILVKGELEDVSDLEILKMSDEFGRANSEIVREAMKFAYSNYEQRAFGHDELRPRSGGVNDKWGGHGVTLIDALDTLWIMDLKDEFFRARDWVRDSLRFDTQKKLVSFFETTIRDLGGLLSAYDLSGDQVFLNKAKDLGDRLLKAFDTASHLPMSRVHLTTGQTGLYAWTKGAVILSEVGTVQLEFRALSHHTNDPKYAEAAMRVHQILREHNKLEHGLYPIYISPKTSKFTTKQVTFGALGDSFYEYLLKLWIQGGRKEAIYREEYDAAMNGVMNKLLKQSNPTGLHYLADWKGGERFDYKMDHLVCFVPGMLALGAYLNPDSPHAKRDMKVAKAVVYTCYQMYERMPTGISPEYVKFTGNDDFIVPVKSPHYLLRPEAVESMFILHYITKHPIYRIWGSKIMASLNKYCRTTYGYSALKDVRNPNGQVLDSMESFFFAETMKYLYLLQKPEKILDLTEWVFNTESHPLRIFNWEEEAFRKKMG